MKQEIETGWQHQPNTLHADRMEIDRLRAVNAELVNALQMIAEIQVYNRQREIAVSVLMANEIPLEKARS